MVGGVSSVGEHSRRGGAGASGKASGEAACWPVALAHGVSAKTSRAGDRVVLRTIEPVLNAGLIVIPAGATVIGSVARVEESRGGRPGAVAIEAEAVTLEDGSRIALDGTLVREGQDYRRSVTGGSVMVGGSLTVPLGRRNATPNLEAGTAFLARTSKDY
jgi:hypothetical protein